MGTTQPEITAIDRHILRRTTTVQTRKHDRERGRRICDLAFKIACGEHFIRGTEVHGWAHNASLKIHTASKHLAETWASVY
jgi:hypothetical protein